MATCAQGGRTQPATHLLVEACQQVWLLFAYEGSDDSLPKLCIRNCLASTPPSCWQCQPTRRRMNLLTKSTFSPKLHTRPLPVAHVRVDNCWSHSRSRLRQQIRDARDKTAMSFPIPYNILLNDA